jgi:pimeloyl-ACP methyl ester carboxylesterase
MAPSKGMISSHPMVFSLVLALVSLPFGFLWLVLAGLTYLFSSPVALSFLLLVGFLLPTYSMTGFAALYSLQSSKTVTVFSILSVLVQLGAWVVIARRDFTSVHRQEKKLSPLFSLCVALPAAAYAALHGYLGVVHPYLALACTLAPIALCLAATRWWLCSPDLRRGAEQEALLLRWSLEGSGVTISQGTSCGMHVVLFHRGGEEGEGGSSSSSTSSSSSSPSSSSGLAPLPPPSSLPRTLPHYPPILFLHGYASGTALYFQNFREVVLAYPGEVYSLDWMGCALSPRVKWPKHKTSVRDAEDAFLDPLEAFLDSRGYPRAVLVGHSLGGYLSTVFWLKRPERVAGLFCLSPAGWSGLAKEIPIPPLKRKVTTAFKRSGWGSVSGAAALASQGAKAGSSSSFSFSGGASSTPLSPTGERSTLLGLTTDSEAEGGGRDTSSSSSSSSTLKATTGSGNSQGGTSGSDSGGPMASLEEQMDAVGAPRTFRPPPFLLSALRCLFARGCTPGILVRGLGPLSRPFVSCTFRSRASRWILERPWPPTITRAMANYMFHTTAAPGCGEHALNKLMTGQATAKIPLLPRVRDAVEQEEGKATCFPRDIPIYFMYGGLYDWMAIDPGRLTAQILTAQGFTNVSVHAVPLSGHFLFLENPSDTNVLILQGLKSVKVTTASSFNNSASNTTSNTTTTQ